MPLTIGARLGPYEILAPLGAGGMGEVYRARDTKLDRAVAIKILPESFSHDPERLARFEREAKTLASLNHPNIAIVHGFEESTGVQAIVMELVEGPTLEERLRAHGSGHGGSGGHGLHLNDALDIARQIAEALEAAHEHGIVHRDLKPGNIKLKVRGAPPPRTEDGRLERSLSAADVADCTVKVLDFGLAKLTQAQGSGLRTQDDLAQSPTITTPVMTQMGVILGTAAYMAPEQARGRTTDKRADIWAFGCVLYEVLAGRRAFDGADVSEVLANVIKSEPDWSALPTNVSTGVRAVLKRCLQKDPKQRLHDIADVRLLMEGAFDSVEQTIAVRAGPLWRRAMPAAIAAVIFTAVGGLSVWNARPAAPPPAVMRSVFTLPENQRFTNTGRHVVAMSPDGTRIAYVANSQLHLRSMSELDAKPIPGTDTPQGVLSPIFSPDGQSIVFWSAADETIKRISVGGGSPATIWQAARPTGLSWYEDSLVFGQGSGGVSRVSASGGKPEVLVSVEDGELAHGPQMLPGGQAVLFTLATGAGADRWDKARIVVQPLSSGGRRTLVENASDARYVPTGHLVYAVSGVLFAVPFDPERLEIGGAAVPVVQGVARAETPEVNSGAAHFSFSNSGALIYIPGPELATSASRSLAFLDRSGNVAPLKIAAGSYDTPRVSPDGRQIAFSNGVGSDTAIFVHELSGSSSPRRLTFGGRNRYPVWSADGSRLTFQSDREGDLAIFWQRADGTDQAARLTKPGPGTSHTPESWSPSGTTMLFSELKEASFSVWAFSLGDKKAEPFGGAKSSGVTGAAFSPDGEWVAYRSNESGSTFVYVQPFPATGSKYQVAAGSAPAWSRDGSEIFFMERGQLTVSSIRTRPSVASGQGPKVMAGQFFEQAASGLLPRSFDIMPDGSILGVVNAAQDQPGTLAAQRIHIVTNWFEELKARVPTR